MLKRGLTLVLFLTIGAIVVFNFKAILSFGRANQIERSAKKAIEAQNWEKAIQLYEEGYQQFPDNDNIAIRLAWLYKQGRQPDKAEQTYRLALQRNPGNENAQIGLADLLKQDPKRINEGVTQLRKALKAHPNDERLLSAIGDLYKTAAENPAEQRESVKKWLYEQAQYYYQASLKLNPRQFQTRFNLGLSYHNINECEAAAKAYCQALLIRPESYQARYNMGLVLSDLNYQAEAYRQMDRAVKILGESNHTDLAQDLALKVQAIKNRIFNSNRQMLGQKEVPQFLDSKCLVQSMAQSVEDASMPTRSTQSEAE